MFGLESYFGGVNYFNPTRNSVIHYDYQAKDLSSLYYSYIGEMIMDKKREFVDKYGWRRSQLYRSWVENCGAIYCHASFTS